MTDPQQPGAPDSGSWDSFWEEIHAAARTETIRGVTITVPTDVPLRIERRMDELRDSAEEADVAELVAELFGADALDTWVTNGMGVVEFKTLIAWGVAQGNGRDISFREAYEKVRAADEEGKPEGPNRAARRAASKKPSASTGGRSKRTSNASTASTRTRSRA